MSPKIGDIADCHNRPRKKFPSLTTTHSAGTLGFIFDEHLTFSDQISTLSKSYYYHIRELRCIRPYLHFKTASTIPSPLSIVNSITVTLYHKLSTSAAPKSRTVLLMLLLRLLNPQISLPFSNLSTGLWSTNALNINFFLLPTKFLQVYNQST